MVKKCVLKEKIIIKATKEKEKRYPMLCYVVCFFFFLINMLCCMLYVYLSAM